MVDQILGSTMVLWCDSICVILYTVVFVLKRASVQPTRYVVLDNEKENSDDSEPWSGVNLVGMSSHRFVSLGE